MLLFLPLIIFGATLVALLAGNLFQRNFRSSWLLSVSGAALSFLALLFLRLRLPLSLSFSAWWAGEGLFSSSSFLLDGVAWLFAYILSGLVLAFFLIQVHEAVSQQWLTWASSLALAAASLLAVFSGDLLTWAFFWVLVDAMATLSVFRQFTKPEERIAALAFLPANISATFLLLAAWILSAPPGQVANLLVLLSAALRLGIFALRHSGSGITKGSNPSFSLRLISITSVLVLLARPLAIEGFALIAVLVLLLLPGLNSAVRFLQPKQGMETTGYFEYGFATLVLAAASLGRPTAAVAFGLALMVGRSLLLLVQNAGRFRWPVIILSAFLLSSLPFSPTISANEFYGSSSIAFAFFPIHATLLAGWLRHARAQAPEEALAEPWMRTMRMLGLVLLPVTVLLFGFGLAPSFSTEATDFSFWPAIVVLIIAALFFIASEKTRPPQVVPPIYASAIATIFSLRWLEASFVWTLRALAWLLNVVSRVLEGQAGVLWALLVIALLLSLASQFALAG
ncbi:MAG: hypothetical protein M1347_02165 [Chloroflexi bacterium]|nr:hypothetical protein [Chloroflexota bacterium]